MTMSEVRDRNWKLFKDYMNTNNFDFDGKNTYTIKNGTGTYKFVCKKNSVEYNKLIGIGRWKKINIGVWYIKDLKIKDNKLLFNRNDLLED